MVRNDFKIMEHFRRRKRSFQTLGLAVTRGQRHVLAQAQPGWGSGPMELALSLLLLSGFFSFALRWIPHLTPYFMTPAA